MSAKTLLANSAATMFYGFLVRFLQAGTGLVVGIAAITRMTKPDQDHIARQLAPMAHHMRIGVIEDDGFAFHPQEPLICHLHRVRRDIRMSMLHADMFTSSIVHGGNKHENLVPAKHETYIAHPGKSRRILTCSIAAAMTIDLGGPGKAPSVQLSWVPALSRTDALTTGAHCRSEASDGCPDSISPDGWL